MSRKQNIKSRQNGPNDILLAFLYLPSEFDMMKKEIQSKKKWERKGKKKRKTGFFNIKGKTRSDLKEAVRMAEDEI